MLEALIILGILLSFVLALKVGELIIIVFCRLLPNRQKRMVWNWLCTNLFIEEEE